MAVFLARAREGGVDDDGSSKTLFLPRKERKCFAYVVLLRCFFFKGLKKVMRVLDSSPL